MGGSAREVTVLIRRMREGDVAAADQLIPLVYAELHAQARRVSAGGRQHSLQPTELVNEAYLKLLGGSGDIDDRFHFLRVAASAMRCVLVDHIRNKHRRKRTPPGERVALDELVAAIEVRSIDALELDEALARLGAMDPRMLQLVELRFFTGLKVSDCAKALGTSLRQTERDWATARAWLRKELA